MSQESNIETLSKLVIGSVISLVIVIVFSRVIRSFLIGLGDTELAVFAGDMIMIAAPLVICMLFFMGYGIKILRERKSS